MALHPLQLEMAAEELLVKQHYLTTMAAEITSAFSGLTESSDVATINSAYEAYETKRQATAEYDNIRLPVLTNTSLFSAIAAEAAV